MDDLPNSLHRDLGRRIELEDAESFFGPVMLVGYQICDEATRLAQPLGFGETKVGLLDLRLRPLSLINVRKQDVPADNLALRVTHTSSTHAEPAVYPVGASKTL